MTATEPGPEPGDEASAPAIDPAAHAALALENVLLRAGVDLESDQGKLVRSAWEGKELDPEAIKRQWELVKPNTEPAPPPEPERLEGEDGQAAERRTLAAGAVVEPNPDDVDPREAAVAAGRAALDRGGTHMDAVATGLHTLLDAAAAGDQRVMAGGPTN